MPPMLQWEVRSQEPAWPVNILAVLLLGCLPGFRGEHSAVAGGACGMTPTRSVITVITFSSRVPFSRGLLEPKHRCPGC